MAVQRLIMPRLNHHRLVYVSLRSLFPRLFLFRVCFVLLYRLPRILRAIRITLDLADLPQLDDIFCLLLTPLPFCWMAVDHLL